MKTLPAVDAVIVGGGWTGLLMAKELGSRTSLSIVVLERGVSRSTEDYADDMDELDYAVRLRMMQDLSQETVTFRHTFSERALPIRQHGAFQYGAGVGGSGEHWAGQMPRYLPDCFELLSRCTEKYGAKRLPEDHSIQDWGVTYNELEPHYESSDSWGFPAKQVTLAESRLKEVTSLKAPAALSILRHPQKLLTFPAFFAMRQKLSGIIRTQPRPLPSAKPTQTLTASPAQHVPIAVFASGLAALLVPRHSRPTSSCR